MMVALADDATAAAVWADLRSRIQLDALEPGSFSLLPLVYRAVEKIAPGDLLLPRLKGIYRSTWVKNNLLFERLRKTVEALDSWSVTFAIVGGVASGTQYYDDLALRPASTIEILVAPSERTAAIAALADIGLTPAAAGTPLWLSDADRNACVLKTQLAPDFGPEPRLLQARHRVGLGGLDTPVLIAGDELVAACVTGARASGHPSVLWIVDLAMILRGFGEAIDWQRFASLSRTHDQALRLRFGLRYVGGLPGVSLPPAAGELLDASSVALRARIAYALAARGMRAGQLGARLLATPWRG